VFRSLDLSQETAGGSSALPGKGPSAKPTARDERQGAPGRRDRPMEEMPLERSRSGRRGKRANSSAGCLLERLSLAGGFAEGVRRLALLETHRGRTGQIRPLQCSARHPSWRPLRGGDPALADRAVLLQDGKSQVGMDHYEHRSWPVWHRHMIYVFLALQFLLRLRIRFKKNTCPDASASADTRCRRVPTQDPDARICSGTGEISYQEKPYRICLTPEEESGRADRPN